MKCPQCGQDNPPQAKFCLECAAPLAARCSQCGTQLSPNAKFCFECATPVVARPSPAAYTPKHLAERILTSKAALEGERKQVTVLFVDVSGFTALSERLDPEDVHELMDRAFEAMLAEVHRYEGTVNQFLGDGIMALFGAPIAHEDHALRAVHAALGIQRALAQYHDQLKKERRIVFQVRMGLNTGAVVVGTIGDNLRMDYTAVGDTTNLAARLLALAEPGQILIELEQAFEIRLELRAVLTQLGEVRRALERLREAEALAERLNDDRQRGRVCAVMTNALALLGELDEALVTGTRALEIAGRLGDVRLRILTTTYLEQAHFLRGDYERVVELATDNLAALPADSEYEYFGAAMPISVYDRLRLIQSLAELGRFAEAAHYEAEALRLAGPTHHAFTVGSAHSFATRLHLLKGDWAKARSLIEHGIAVLRTGNILLNIASTVASSARVLAQVGEASEALTRLREGEQLLEHQAEQGVLGRRGEVYHSLGCAGLLLSRLDEARRLGDRALKYSPSHVGFAAHALHLLGDIATHPDRFDAESGEAHYRNALTLAEPRGMRPLVAHCHLGLGKLPPQTGRQNMSFVGVGAGHPVDDADPRYTAHRGRRERGESWAPAKGPLRSTVSDGTPAVAVRSTARARTAQRLHRRVSDDTPSRREP
jgi:class 3 adenylate cyclase